MNIKRITVWLLVLIVFIIVHVIWVFSWIIIVMFTSHFTDDFDYVWSDLDIGLDLETEIGALIKEQIFGVLSKTSNLARLANLELSFRINGLESIWKL